ncbi:MAG TPA: amidohydrolase family protein [Candidatus Dormibacteraeota bacterium]|jgi:4-oxalmesaconate hydratase
MIIDAHGHVSAPPEFYAYRSVLLASRGYHGKGSPGVSDERLRQAADRHLDLLRNVGTDVQFLSPRPFQLMHSEQPESIVRWWVEANNDIIARQCRAFPDVFRGVAGLPQTAAGSIQPCVEELERCVKEHGFIGCLINPDPTEGTGLMPTLDNEYWYPLYEKMVELDVPALVHSAACKHFRESYSAHFITEESVAVLNLCKVESRVFQDFPSLRLIISHGGGSVPYQIGRWRAHRFRERESDPSLESFDESLRRLYYDTVLYNQESLDFLFRIIGTDRCLFGTENPGSGSSRDPATGRWLDDLKPVIEGVSWLSDTDRSRIFEDNARAVFPRFRVSAPV